jgi:ATP-binding cassette subfamily B protein
MTTRSVPGTVPAASRPRAWLWPLLRPNRRAVFLAAAAVLTQTAGALISPYLVEIGINDGILTHRPTVLNRVAAAYLAVTAARFLANRVEILSVAQAGQNVLLALRSRLFAHLQTLSLDFYEQERPGGIVARMTNDIEAIGTVLSDGIIGLITGLITLLGIGAILILLDWRLALITLLVVPPLAALAIWFRRRTRPAWRAVREAATTVTVRLQEALTGIHTIQAFHREQAAADQVDGASQSERRARWRAVLPTIVFYPSVDLFGGVATVIILVAGGHQVIAGHLQLGTLAAFLLYLAIFFGPVGELLGLYSSVQAATAGAERVGMVFARSASVAEPLTARHLPGVERHIQLEHVSFGYPGESGNPGPAVLDRVDLEIPVGSTTALVGATGAGKSTIAKMITRCYDPQGGRVSIDGVDVRALATSDLHRIIGYVPQEGFLFSGTVRDNVAFGRPGATDAQVEAAVRATGAESLLGGLPDGLDTDVGERGARLSAGERQLISLARAWIADPAVLVLDEATSSLDAEADGYAAEAVRRLRHGRTTLIIAHRPATALTADLVAVISDGRVVETGKPGDLLDAGGAFAILHSQRPSADAPTENGGLR